MAVKFTNRATSLLASSISDIDTALSVTAATGSRYPSLTLGDWFPLVVVDGAGAYEIMRATARSGDVMTVTRAQEGTSALSFTAGARVDLRLTAEAIAGMIADAAVVSTAYTDAAKTTLRGELNAPAGTKAMFVQTAAPTGWTKDTDHNDKALRVVSGSVSSGGTNPFSTAQAAMAVSGTALTQAQLPNVTLTTTIAAGQGSHQHPDTGTSSNQNFGTNPAGFMSNSGTHQTQAATLPEMTGTTPLGGSGSTHNHTLTMAMQYVDVIIATKD